MSDRYEMSKATAELYEKIRSQFNYLPYPVVNLEASPKMPQPLFLHNFTTAYYRAYRRIPPDVECLSILDAGCGSGWTTLLLAEANPRAKIVGIDLSPASIEVAKERLRCHGYEQTEFLVMAVEDITTLGQKFDYINCDEMLYLVPDPVETLKAFRSVLKPQGLIRANLHSLYQREAIYHIQAALKMFGLMDGPSSDLEIEIAQSIWSELKDTTRIKKIMTPMPKDNDLAKQWILMNFLLRGDKGYTVTSMFELLEVADLEFVSMVNHEKWDLRRLFKDPQNLPPIIELGLATASQQAQLQLLELLNPAQRLLDFWCTLPGQHQDRPQMEAWTEAEWSRAKVYLHPQLQSQPIVEAIRASVKQRQSIELTQLLQANSPHPIFLGPMVTACLWPLWAGSCEFKSFIERWKKLFPLDLINLEPTSEAEVSFMLKQLFLQLEQMGFLLLEVD